MLQPVALLVSRGSAAVGAILIRVGCAVTRAIMPFRQGYVLMCMAYVTTGEV